MDEIHFNINNEMNEISTLGDNDILDNIEDEESIKEEPQIKKIYLEPTSKNEIKRRTENNDIMDIKIPIFSKNLELDLRSEANRSVVKREENNFNKITVSPKSLNSSSEVKSDPIFINNQVVNDGKQQLNKTVVQEQYTPIVDKLIPNKNKIIRVIKRNKKGLLRRSDNNRHILIKDAPDYESDKEIQF